MNLLDPIDGGDGSQQRDADARFLCRDLSDLAYVRRILGQAEAPATPLAERLRFVGISSSVLDEFVAVRLDSWLPE